MKGTTSTVLLAIAVISFPQPALAYLDPGAGSMILQMLIAGIMGALFTIKMYWYRIKAWFARVMGREVEAESDEPDDGLAASEDNG